MREWYHEDCRPTCDLPGCRTPALGFGSQCWVHRLYNVTTWPFPVHRLGAGPRISAQAGRSYSAFGGFRVGS